MFLILKAKAVHNFFVVQKQCVFTFGPFARNLCIKMGIRIFRVGCVRYTLMRLACSDHSLGQDGKRERRDNENGMRRRR